jgi:hypothetical protein
VDSPWETFELPVINSSLSAGVDVGSAAELRANQEPPVVYNGQFPRHHGFVLTPEEASQLIAADPRNRDVVHPFLIGAEMLTHGAPQRWVIDFQKRDLFEARSYAAPFEHLLPRVLPRVTELAEKEKAKSGKSTGQDQPWLKMWWQFFRCRKELIDRITGGYESGRTRGSVAQVGIEGMATVSTLSAEEAIVAAGAKVKAGGLPRYMACCEVTKRPIFCFIDPDIRPDHTLEAFVFADDYSFGVIQSDLHAQWFKAKCSRLKGDFRYTPKTVFDTFPWPQTPTKAQIAEVAAAAVALRALRREIGKRLGYSRRALYLTLEEPGANPLREAHTRLDTAVHAAYAMPKAADPLTFLLTLNLTLAAKEKAGEKITPPGLPLPDAGHAPFITEDCVRPLL